MKFDPGEVIHFNPGDPLPISTDTPALLRLYLEKYDILDPKDKDLIRQALAQALNPMLTVKPTVTPTDDFDYRTCGVVELATRNPNLAYMEEWEGRALKAEKLGVHLSHCNFGENANVCKYGDDDCPALTPQWLWLGKALQERKFRETKEDSGRLNELAAKMGSRSAKI